MNDEKQAAKTIKQQHDITKFLMNFPRKTTLSSELLPTEQYRDDVTVVPVMLQYRTHLHLPIQTFKIYIEKCIV